MQGICNLPAGFFDEEERLGYRVSSEMKKIWAIELELMEELDRVCSRLNLRYFLDSGTLLGAVRDGHFIPWDDDIDVILLREDYDTLIQKGEHLFSQDYHLQCAYTDVDYPRGHAQLRKKNTCAMIPYEAKHVKFDQGIFIDIFVLDGVTTDEQKLTGQFKDKNRIMWKMETVGIPASTKPLNTIIKKVLRAYYKLTAAPIKDLFKKYEEICKRYNSSDYVDKIMFRETVDAVIPLEREWYAETVMVPFEGGLFPAPIGYEEVCKAYYGDNYMIPAKAPSAHGSTILDDTRSYKQVLKEMKNKRISKM